MHSDRIKKAADPASRKVRFSLLIGTPRLSPDAWHLAYLAMIPLDSVMPRWPRGRAERSFTADPAFGLLETDAGVDQIAWLDAGRFRIELALTVQTGGLLGIEGSVDSTVSVDTISREALDRVVLP